MAFRTRLSVIHIALVLLALYSVNAFERIPKSRLFKRKANLQFSWQNCGPATDPLQLKSIFITPDPILVPGSVTFNGTGFATSAIPTDLYVVVTMEKKIGNVYRKIPCVDNIGSCNYQNLCDLWSSVCSEFFPDWGIPCNCPIPPNAYTVPTTTEYIQADLPSILDGDFRLTGDFRSASGHIGCLQAIVTIKSA